MRLTISDHERAALAEVTQFPLFAAITGRTTRIRQYRIRRVTSRSRRFHLMNQSTLLRQLPPLRADRSGVITGAIRLL
jgi:hypothetical protein